MAPTTRVSRLTHVKFGRISGMSTRKGAVVLLEDLLNEGRDRALKTIQETASKSCMICLVSLHSLRLASLARDTRFRTCSCSSRGMHVSDTLPLGSSLISQRRSSRRRLSRVRDYLISHCLRRLALRDINASFTLSRSSLQEPCCRLIIRRARACRFLQPHSPPLSLLH